MLSTHNKFHGFSKEDIILAHSSMSFDLSVAQMWGSLTSGATMALAAPEARMDPVQLARFMRDANVTITYIPATQYSLLLEYNSDDLRQCTNYRRALFAGEYLPVRLVKAIYDLKTPVAIFNQWGPTETTVQTTSSKIPYPGPTELNLPVGLPIPNNSHYVVDSRMKPVPASVSGEICIGGAQVGRGYLNRPEATADTFIRDPFASKSFRAQGWETLYKTGDKGRFLSSGEIDFKGRISGDKQIKLRGTRIDLAEIENEIHLASQQLKGQKVVDVAVLPCPPATIDPNFPDDKRLIAFVVFSRACVATEQQMLVNSLHKSLGVALNEAMLPAGYRFMNTLTTLVSAKVDRQMLLRSTLDLVYPSSDHENPDNKGDYEIMGDVIQAFRDVLKIGPNRSILPSESFFDLGGQSILLLRLRAVLKRKLKVDITLPELFKHPTPLGIAKHLLGFPDEEEEASPIKHGKGEVDWMTEANLPNDSRYKVSPSVVGLSRANITEILVTGVDSFSGGHMLATLLSTCPSAMIHVIGSEVELEPFDIEATFEQWQLFSDSITPATLTSRVRCVPGKLSLDHFGLNDHKFQELGRSVQAIYHCGGHVSLLKTYHDLKRLNVGSTLDLIELAKYGIHLTELHYLSSWSVPHLQSWSNTKRTLPRISTTESNPSHFRPGGGEELGYFKSRWVAEMLLSEAATRGFPVSIYRASAVTASSKASLATPDDNFTHNLILSMIASGQVPDMNRDGPEFSIDFVPIDYLTETLARLSTNDAVVTDDNLAYYHIGNPSPLPLSSLTQMMSRLRDDGKEGTTLPLSEWAQKMKNKGGSDEQAQIEWTVFQEFLDLGHTMFSLDNEITNTALGKLAEKGEECPAVDEEYLRGLLEVQKKRRRVSGRSWRGI